MTPASGELPQTVPDELKARFRWRYGGEARLFRAPGRVNLIGEHTDYDEGHVMPVAIDREVVVAAADRSDRQVRVYSEQLDSECDFEPQGHWRHWKSGAVFAGPARHEVEAPGTWTFDPELRLLRWMHPRTRESQRLAIRALPASVARR